ncbi:hypothetical protein DLAC_09121 [Tieghemostelium lacteum]|uniref:Uncharacterized protein n=1 Tax=Tieghemostelium lacteum TaxID=361077 RepID=A0A151Z988_TIELA|nr:hypothetical protein DLAC_09121 [Tieghemostelium lacteum]|eukprot:KYQ90496.1 hypothetical protein DLAC_09121 [Tieghemostelium lacteum]
MLNLSILVFILFISGLVVSFSPSVAVNSVTISSVNVTAQDHVCHFEFQLNVKILGGSSTPKSTDFTISSSSNKYINSHIVGPISQIPTNSKLYKIKVTTLVGIIKDFKIYLNGTLFAPTDGNTPPIQCKSSQKQNVLIPKEPSESLALRLMMLPNHILQKIFEYRVQLECNLKIYYRVIVVFALVSKRIQLEVLPKLRRNSLRFSIENQISQKELDFLKRLDRITGQCRLQYTTEIKKSAIDSFLQIAYLIPHFRTKVTRLELWDLMLPKDDWLFDIFTNVEDISIQYDKIDGNVQVFPVIPVQKLSNVNFEISLRGLLNSLSEVDFIKCFNTNQFKKISISGTTIDFTKYLSDSNENNRLTELSILFTLYESSALSVIIDRSPSLTTLVLDRIRLDNSPDNDFFNSIINLKNLVNFEISTSTMWFKPIVKLLNNIKCNKCILYITTLDCDSEEELYGDKIVNGYIKHLKVTKSMIRENRQKQFSLLSIWRSLSTIETLEFEYSPCIPIDMFNELTSTSKITYLTSIKSKAIEQLILLDLPKLKEMKFYYQPESAPPLIFNQNHYITTLDFDQLNFNDLSQFLTLDNQTLQSLSISCLIIDKGYLYDALPLFQANTTLSTIQVFTVYQKKNGRLYNQYQFILSILLVNSKVQRLTFPSAGPLNSSTYNDYKTLLRSERVKNLWHIGVSFTKHPELLDILSQCSITSSSK